MRQTTLNLDLNLKKTCKREFLEQMEQVVPWTELVALILPYHPEGLTGRPPFSLTPMLREFAQLQEFARLPDESTILRFRHRLEKHKLAEQILASVNDILTQRGLLLKTGLVVDATLIAAPTSTKNKSKERDPEIHSSSKGNQWYFGMKAHIGADAESGLVHTVRGTSGQVNDITQAYSLLHGREQIKDNEAHALIDQAEELKASVRAKVEHPFLVIKRQSGFVRVRYRGIKNNTAQQFTLFALSNRWMMRGKLMGVGA